MISEVSIGLGKYFHWTSFSVTVPVSGCYWGGSRLPGCHGDLPAVPELPRALPRLLLRHQFPSSSIGDEFEVLQNEQNHSIFLRLIDSIKYFHWTSFSAMVPVSSCYWGGSRLLGCHGDLPAVPELPRALPRLLLRHQFPSSSIGDEFEVLQNEQNHSIFLRLIDSIG